MNPFSSSTLPCQTIHSPEKINKRHIHNHTRDGFSRKQQKKNEKTESVLLNNIITILGEKDKSKRYYLVRSLIQERYLINRHDKHRKQWNPFLNVTPPQTNIDRFVSHFAGRISNALKTKINRFHCFLSTHSYTFINAIIIENPHSHIHIHISRHSHLNIYTHTTG